MISFFHIGSTIVAKILELGFCFLGRRDGLVLVLTLEYEHYVVQSAYMVSAVFYSKECMVYVKCFSCSAHFIPHMLMTWNL